ncbi:hypothetical protein ADUPG1_008792, partial [Aduncisulcus paluster]
RMKGDKRSRASDEQKKRREKEEEREVREEEEEEEEERKRKEEREEEEKEKKDIVSELEGFQTSLAELKRSRYSITNQLSVLTRRQGALKDDLKRKEKHHEALMNESERIQRSLDDILAGHLDAKEVMQKEEKRKEEIETQLKKAHERKEHLKIESEKLSMSICDCESTIIRSLTIQSSCKANINVLKRSLRKKRGQYRVIMLKQNKRKEEEEKYRLCKGESHDAIRDINRIEKEMVSKFKPTLSEIEEFVKECTKKVPSDILKEGSRSGKNDADNSEEDSEEEDEQSRSYSDESESDSSKAIFRSEESSDESEAVIEGSSSGEELDHQEGDKTAKSQISRVKIDDVSSEFISQRISILRKSFSSFCSLISTLKSSVDSLDLTIVEEFQRISNSLSECQSSLFRLQTSHKNHLISSEKLLQRRYSIISSSISRLNSLLSSYIASLTGTDSGWEACLHLPTAASVLDSEGVELSVRPGRGGWIDTTCLSGGQKAIVSICFSLACIIITGSRMLVLDEVDAALDKVFSERLGLLLAKISASGNVALCVVSLRPETYSSCSQTVCIWQCNRSTKSLIFKAK